MGIASPARISKAHWLGAGMELLVAQGPDSLSVAQLCQYVGRTKGSFYHHFQDHQQFIDALVAAWQEQNLHQLIEETGGGSSRSRLSALTALSAELNPEEEMAIRLLAGRNEKVRTAVALVDGARMDYLALLYREAGMKPAQARDAAKIQYAGFVGAQSLWPTKFGHEVRSLGSLVNVLLMGSLDSDA